MKNIRPALFLATLAFAAAALVASPTAAFAASDPKLSDKKTAPAPGKPKPYPLDVCLVTDNDLGSMGEETSIVYEGQVIKFCCKPCEEKFLKNPAKYLAKLAPAGPAKK
jgi:hypothetical protein